MNPGSSSLAEFRNGDYVWARSRDQNRWQETRVVQVDDQHVLLHTVDAGAQTIQQVIRVDAKEELRQRSLWPGEESKSEHHANLASMLYFNSPEVAASLSLGMHPDKTLLVPTMLHKHLTLCRPALAPPAMRASLWQQLHCVQINGVYHLPKISGHHSAAVHDRRCAVSDPNAGASRSIVIFGSDASLKRKLVQDVLNLPVLTRQRPEVPPLRIRGLLREMADRVAEGLEVLAAFTEASVDLPSPSRSTIRVDYVFGPEGGVGAHFATYGLDRDSISAVSFPSLSVLHAVQSLAQRGDDSLRSSFCLQEAYRSLHVLNATAHPRPPMEEILGILENSFGVDEAGSRSVLEVLSAVLWLLNDSAPLPTRLVGLMPETVVQLRDHSAAHRRGLAEVVFRNSEPRHVANKMAELYVGLLDWVTLRINRSLHLPLAVGSKRSSFSLLLLPASSCRGDAAAASVGNWQALVHNYINVRAHLGALRSEECRLRATLKSDGICASQAHRVSQAVLATEQCLELYEEILATEGHTDAVLPHNIDDEVHESRIEQAKRAVHDLSARIDGHPALLRARASSGALGIVHTTCDAWYHVQPSLSSRSAALPMPLRVLLSSSRNEIVASHFAILNENGAAQSPLQRWRRDGHALQSVMDSSDCTFIHCINPIPPSKDRQPRAFDESLVHAQLCDQWFCDFALLADAYLPVHLSHSSFLRACQRQASPANKESSLLAAEEANLQKDHYLIGESRVYLSRAAFSQLQGRGSAVLRAPSDSSSSSLSVSSEKDDALSSVDSAPSSGDAPNLEMVERVERGSVLMRHLPPPAPSMPRLAVEQIREQKSDSRRPSNADKRDAIPIITDPVSPSKLSAERHLRTAMSMQDLSEIEDTEKRAKMDSNTEIAPEEEQLFRSASLPARHLEILLKLSKASSEQLLTSLPSLSASYLFIDAKITEELSKLSDGTLTARLATLALPDASGDSHFVAMLYIWRTLQAIRFVLRPDPLAPHVHADRLSAVRTVGIIHKIVQLLHRVDTYAPILRDPLFHSKLELLCIDILIAFVARSPVRDACCIALGSESNVLMIARTLERRLRYQSWISVDVRVFVGRLVQLLCTLLANERSLAALQKVCKIKRKKSKANDTLSATLCVCTNLLLGSPNAQLQLLGVKLFAHAAPIASQFYRSYGVLEALLEPLHSRSAEYVHDTGAALLQSRTTAKKTKLLGDAIECGAVKALVGALARPEREVREKSLLLLCTFCCPTLLGKSESKRNFHVAAKYLTPLGPSAPLLLQTAAREPTRAALEALLTLLDQSGSRVSSLRAASVA